MTKKLEEVRHLGEKKRPVSAKETYDRDYSRYAFSYPTDTYKYVLRPGLSREVIEEISAIKNEPKWMREFRLQAYEVFLKKPLPTWGADLSEINFDTITYYATPSDKRARSWEDVPEEVKKTFDRLGIPEAERKFLAGVGAQYDCLTADTIVFANPGAVPIAHIQPGQLVYSLDLNTRRLIKQRVLGVVYKGKLPVFEVKVAGRCIKATFNHPFLALLYHREEGKQRGRFEVQWRYLSDLKVGDYIAVVKQLPDEGKPYRLPPVDVTSVYLGRNQKGAFPVRTEKLFRRTQKKLRIPEYTSEALMWFLGAYLGDGGLRRKAKGQAKTYVDIAFPASDHPCRQKLAKVLQDAFGYALRLDKDPYRVRIHCVPIVRLLAALGLDAHATTKSLPPWVFSVPRSQKLAFIAGYIDSDGHVRGDDRNSDAILTSANQALLRDVQRLAITCGLRVSDVFPFCSKTTYKGKTTKRTAYRLMLMGDLQPLIPYSVKVASRYAPRKYHHRYNSHHKVKLDAHTSEDIGFAPIESIRYLGFEPTYDIEVEGVHNFIAEGIVVHNSEVVYHSIREDLKKKGVIFLSMDDGLREYPELVKEYFGTVIPPTDNKFAALNSAVWSGGSFIYVPKGVQVEIPLQAYFRINAPNMGQFERTLIIADEGSRVQYVEGCTAPIYSKESLHSAVVELIAKRGAHLRYTTLQNWSNDVYNLVTKRAVAYEDATVEWVDANIGCLTADTKVFLNPRGAVNITEVKPNDWVYALDLNAMKVIKRRVKGVLCTGVKPVFKLTTENFREIKATANHPFLVLQRPTGGKHWQMEWKPLEQLHPGDYIALNQGLPDEGQPYRIEYQSSLKRTKVKPQLPQETSEELMWLLGLYVGDGFVERGPHQVPRRVYFAVPERDPARSKLIALLRQLFAVGWKPKGISVTVNSAILADFLLSLGFSGTAKEKRIPRWVFGLPLRQKLAFIEGYLDADGHVRQHQGKDGKLYGQLTFASCNRELLEDLKLLMISCGLNPLKISSYSRERLLLGQYKGTYTTHYLNLPLSDLETIRAKSPPQPSVEFVKVLSIEPLGEEAVYDIEVEDAHNFIANGLVVHNSRVTMKYPAVYMLGKGARADILSVAFAGKGQHQDTGGKAIHAAPYTTSTIVSKSVSKDGGRATYRGQLVVAKGAHHAKSNVRCDALLLDERSRSDTYPYIEIDEDQVTIGHEATVGKVGDDQIFYLQSRGLSESEALSMIVLGFMEPFTKTLPMEYAIEFNRLIQLEMEGSVG